MKIWRNRKEKRQVWTCLSGGNWQSWIDVENYFPNLSTLFSFTIPPFVLSSRVPPPPLPLARTGTSEQDDDDESKPFSFFCGGGDDGQYGVSQKKDNTLG
jgi:hypothetical protein